MTRTQRLILMFAPLMLGFVGMAFAIQDLRHPTVNLDECQYVGRGAGLADFKDRARPLYQASGKPENDIGFDCREQGAVYINDDVPLPVKPGQAIKISMKDYRYFPTRYNLAVPVINPNEAAINQKP